MTRDEHKDIIAFIEKAAKPATVRELPIDVEADAIIRALFVRNPEAAYRITQLAMAQASEIVQASAEIEAIKQSFRGNWLSRFLKKDELPARNQRQDSRLPQFAQGIRSR